MAPRTRRGLTTVLPATLMLLATGCVATGAEQSESDPKTASSAAAAAEDSPSTSADTSPPPPSATPDPLPLVPRVSGLSQADAERALVAAGLTVGEITEVPSARPAGTVLRQGVEVGTSMAAGTGVALALAVAYPQVPFVVGRTQRVATSLLRAAGFRVQAQQETRSSGRGGMVLSQTPLGTELAKPGAIITIVVSRVVRAVAPPVSHSCTPGYTPCLSPASDYDCAGGSGDGPEYAVGPITVTGSDPYDLDSEGDGIACE